MAKKSSAKKVPAEIKKLPAGVARLVKYLDSAGARHEIIEHKTVFTAYDVAATLKKKLNEIAKSLLVKADKNYYAVILPADQRLDLEKLKKVISRKDGKEVKVIKIPTEKAMTELLKVKNTAMTAFGNLHNLPVVAEKGLEKARKLIFSSGGFNHSVEMKLNDFVKLENAILGKFGVKSKVKLVKR